MKNKVKKYLINISKKIKVFLDKISNDPQEYSSLNTDGERALFFEYLKKSKYYFEFGSGGSTFEALKAPISEIYSIECSKSWYKKLLSWKFISKAQNKRLFYEYVDIGKTGDWAFPINDDNKDLWPNYSSAFDRIESKKNKIDTVLVDGRFRVACVLNVLLSCNENTIIIVHDFPNRPYYHCLLQFLNPIKTMDELYVFNIKENLDKNEISDLYEKYKFDYR